MSGTRCGAGTGRTDDASVRSRSPHLQQRWNRPSGRVWELSLNDWDAVLRVDLMGVIYGLRSFVPLLLASGEEGHVVNVASMASVVPVPGISPYNVSKHGVLALSETLHGGTDCRWVRRSG